MKIQYTWPCICICAYTGVEQGKERGTPSQGPAFLRGQQTQTQHRPLPDSFKPAPQTTSFGSSVCEKAKKLEKIFPQMSLLNHALMYISTSQPLAIKTHTQICPPKTCLKIDIVLKQTHRPGNSNPDLSQDEARLFQPLQTEDLGGTSRGAVRNGCKATRGTPINAGPLWHERVWCFYVATC